MSVRPIHLIPPFLLLAAACSDGAGGASDAGESAESGSDDGTAEPPLETEGQGDDATGGQLGAGGEDGSGGGVGTGGEFGTGGDAGSGGDPSTGGTGGTVDPGGPPPGTYLMDDDGYVMFEIESLAGEDPPGDWVYVADEERSGGGYYQHLTDGLDNCGQYGNGGNGEMTLQFEAKESGYYRMVWSNMRDTGTAGCANDRNNDSYAKFPGALNDSHFTDWFKIYGGGVGSFSWGGNYDIHGLDPQRGQVCVQLDAGIQTMEISARSNYHAIDRIAIIYGDENGCSGSTSNLDERDNTGQAP